MTSIGRPAGTSPIADDRSGGQIHLARDQPDQPDRMVVRVDGVDSHSGSLDRRCLSAPTQHRLGAIDVSPFLKFGIVSGTINDKRMSMPEQPIRLQSSMASRAHSMSRRMAIPWSRCWSNPAALILLRSTNGVAPNRSLSARRLSHSQSAAISLRFPRFASASANLTASARYRRMTTASLFRRGDGRALPILLDSVSL